MNWAEVLGWAGALAVVCITLPQFFLVVRTKQTHGLALTTWVIAIGTSIGWFDHGLRLMEPVQIWPNILGLVNTAVIIYFLRRNRRFRSWTTLLPGFALGGLLVGLDWGVSSAAFGIAVIVPQAYGMIRQGIALMRAAAVTGVSISAWVAQVANQAIWLAWSILKTEWGTGISAAVSVVCAGFVLTWRLLRLAGIGPVLTTKPAPVVDAT